MSSPRLLFCAPQSGGGKTTVVCALLRALVRRGKKPVAFKCGPDYIDPMFHTEIIGAHSRNLDLFFLGGEKTRWLLRENARRGDVSVIEGVMGYYDGIGMSGEASAWQLSRETQTPAVLVADARGRALSAAALVKGFLEFREPSGIAGVVLTRCSAMLYPRLKEAIERETGLRVYGFLPECPEAALESRHLGLVTAAEVEDLRGKLDLLAAACEENMDIDGLLALAQTAPELCCREPELPEPLAQKVRVAVARDRAFCFYYADALELLERLGAELVPFSPLHDGALPERCAGLYLGGGYPELYAGELSQNRAMRRAVRAAIRDGMPVIAECGGFLYLHDTLEGQDGGVYPMAGAINACAFRTPRLKRFGYITVRTGRDSFFGPAGTQLPAHEFHYWDSEDPGAGMHAVKPQSERAWDCAHISDTMYAGFPHFHLWSAPEAAAGFLRACEKYGSDGKWSFLNS